MKYLDEYRQAEPVRRLVASIEGRTTRPWTLMEVCGGQTHSIVRFGIDRMLPETIRLIHGPGCPVCVTPTPILDQAMAIAARPGVLFTSFGDMLRVPGSATDLLTVKSSGGDIRIVYSPMDALELAARHPDREVVFLAVGFETTAPAHAMAVREAARRGLGNFSILASLVRVPPALVALLESPDCQVEAFLAAGHVCTIMGTAEYEPIADRYGVPIVVTGFEPVDLLLGIDRAVARLEAGAAGVEIAYARSVRPEGNAAARRAVEEVFEVVDREWRGLGRLPASGLAVRAAYARHDAAVRFDVDPSPAPVESECISGLVLQGIRRPDECPAFGTGCHPDAPLGATMVSSEGACAAYYRYRGVGR